MRVLVKVFVAVFCLFSVSCCYGGTGKNSLKKVSYDGASMHKKDHAAIAWESLKEATEASQRDRKPICLFFTGSDWCIWCIRMEKQIMSTPEFANFSRKHLHMVLVDFPQSTPLDESTKQQNRLLKQKYNVNGFPELVFIDSEGKVLSRQGYEQGGARPYISKLKRELSIK
ncbi:disulfide reductase DsbH [Chlamydiifrater phoenicopteri]|uniref:disulfide reductase DsbH n=1 Tax=Chlamydiifrater phoenicopteri TaxID=2681469 RepID=UPI001BCF63A7|nr:disulfide reductase DsbH [Chlamydiifrater phoenicopteri]